MSRRLAVVFPLALERQHLGKDVLLIPEGLQRLGFSVELHCPRALGGDWPVPVVEAGPRGLEDPEHWRGHRVDGAVVFSFLRFARVLHALRAAGAEVVAKGDTTGHVIARAHPRQTLDYALYDPSDRLRGALSVGYWLARMGPLHRREARALVASVAAARATAVETTEARAAAARALEYAGARELVDRLQVIPNPVAERFLRGPVPPERDRLVVAIGRWQLKVKGADLLRAALERFLASHPEHHAVIVGSGAERLLGSPRVEHQERLTSEEMAGLLGRARIVVSSSRWESFSLASHEGLAMGCTVVGPPLAPLRDAVAAGPYGTLAPRRDADALAAAVAHEAGAWERGERDPVASAAYWRAHLDPEGIARRFAALLAQPAAEVRGGSSSTPA